MSIDTHMLLRTPLPAAEVRAALVHDPALADLGLEDFEGLNEVGNDGINLVILPWDEDDRTLVENGFETATVRITFIPAKGKAGRDPYRRTFAAVLRLVPGDACAQEQGGGPLGLLRLDGTVYVDPNWLSPENLSRYGYAPERIVVGIPSQTAEAAAE